MNRFHISVRTADFKAKAFCVLRLVEHFRGVDKSFRGHAAPQNTETAQLSGAIDNGYFKAEPCRHARGIKSRAATTNADKIVNFQSEERGAAKAATQRLDKILIMGPRAIRRFIA